MGSINDYTFTVYRGTFIESRILDSGSKPELTHNQGALWVSTADGRIKGWDWQAHDDNGFAELMSQKGWVDIDAVESGQVNGHVSSTRVKVVIANEENNEFFFPGFIGMIPT